MLGYIFEKYINQKQMGAYYTKEDITEYISKNTVIPFLFDAAKSEVQGRLRESRRADGLGSACATIRTATSTPPSATACEHARLPPEDRSRHRRRCQRERQWNKTGARRLRLCPPRSGAKSSRGGQRYAEVRAKLAAGEVREINDLITLNLDIRQFAQDVIETCEGPDLLRAFWQAIESVTVLDPTCGSGAFLFAALNILEPLYEACLDRMEAFVDDLERSGEGNARRSSRTSR